MCLCLLALVGIVSEINASPTSNDRLPICALSRPLCLQMPTLSMTNTPQLLTIRDAALALQVNYATARKWVLDGRLPSIALGQRTRRIPAIQLAKFISANTTGGN